MRDCTLPVHPAWEVPGGWPKHRAPETSNCGASPSTTSRRSISTSRTGKLVGSVRRQRQRQDEPGPRHALCRGAAALHRELLALHAAVPRAARQAGGRADRRPARRHRRHAGRRLPLEPGDRRHGDRDDRLPAAAVRQDRPAGLSRRAASPSSEARPKRPPSDWPNCRKARGSWSPFRPRLRTASRSRSWPHGCKAKDSCASLSDRARCI